MKSNKVNKSTLQELANYLGVSLSAVKQYKKEKRKIMLIGLYYYEKNKKKAGE